MTLYVMDTDILGFAFQRHSKVLQRIQRLPEDDLIVTTIITFGEDLSGWLPACRRAPDGAARSRAYARLQRGLDFYRRWICLPFDAAAAVTFDELRAETANRNKRSCHRRRHAFDRRHSRHAQCCRLCTDSQPLVRGLDAVGIHIDYSALVLR